VLFGRSSRFGKERIPSTVLCNNIDIIFRFQFSLFLDLTLSSTINGKLNTFTVTTVVCKLLCRDKPPSDRTAKVLAFPSFYFFLTGKNRLAEGIEISDCLVAM